MTEWSKNNIPPAHQRLKKERTHSSSLKGARQIKKFLPWGGYGIIIFLEGLKAFLFFALNGQRSVVLTVSKLTEQ